MFVFAVSFGVVVTRKGDLGRLVFLMVRGCVCLLRVWGGYFVKIFGAFICVFSGAMAFKCD